MVFGNKVIFLNECFVLIWIVKAEFLLTDNILCKYYKIQCETLDKGFNTL